MNAWCHALDSEGKPVDPEGMCQDFQTPPAGAISSFEARLPELLSAKGRADLAPKIHDYVRQYWGVVRAGRLNVVGNFVCRSLAVRLATPFDDIEPLSSDSIAHVPITVDAAGACSVTASFPADQPDDVEF